MSVEEYLKKIRENQKLVLLQGRTPFLLNHNNEQKKVSEEIFSRKEIYSFLSYVGIGANSLKGVNYFYNDGKKYQVNSLVLSDVIQLEISLADVSLFTFSDLVLPGYVFDWAQSNKGLVIFYGSDLSAIRKFSLSFSKYRAEQTKGSSLIFSNSDSSFVGKPEHRLVFSENQAEYLKTNSAMKSFDHISFCDEVEKESIDRLMFDIDQQALVSSPVIWSDVSSTWGALREHFNDERRMKFLVKNLVGFVGVKSVESQTGKQEYLFEAVPFNKNNVNAFAKMSFDEQSNKIEEMKESKGYSFNQSIQALLLKRRIILENAYEVSPDPQELNNMLTQVGF